jgi:hypothetical protein
MASPQPADPTATINRLRVELKNLLERHEKAARSFEVNSGMSAVLVDWGLTWAEDNLDLPTSRAKEVADRLQLAWTESQLYRGLLVEFDRLLMRVKEELAPLFKGRLPFTGVYSVKTLATKIRRIDTVLLSLDDRARAWQVAGRAPPVGHLRVPRGPRKRGAKREFWRPQTFSEWFTVFVGVVVLLSLAIPALGDLERDILTLPGTLAIGILLIGIGVILVWRRARIPQKR